MTAARRARVNQCNDCIVMQLFGFSSNKSLVLDSLADVAVAVATAFFNLLNYSSRKTGLQYRL
jgi:hypothetical protein